MYKENYGLSNSLTEIFYDFHTDPILIIDSGNYIKANKMFIENFGHLVRSRTNNHHSQMVAELINPEKLCFSTHCDPESVSLIEIIKNKDEWKEKELVLKSKLNEKIYMFTFYQLENIYNKRIICIFKDTTHIHQLQMVKSQVEFRSVIMGCLTHELRTPVNCALSILKTLEDYIEPTEEARKLLNICQSTIEMLRCLTEDFLDFTRFENKKGLPIKVELFNLSHMMSDIQSIFEFQAEEKNLKFKINICKFFLNSKFYFL